MSVSVRVSVRVGEAFKSCGAFNGFLKEHESFLLDDHHHVQSAALATKTASRSKTAPTLCTCHEKSTLEHQNTRFPLRQPRKVTTMY